MRWSNTWRFQGIILTRADLRNRAMKMKSETMISRAIPINKAHRSSTALSMSYGSSNKFATKKTKFSKPRYFICYHSAHLLRIATPGKKAHDVNIKAKSLTRRNQVTRIGILPRPRIVQVRKEKEIATTCWQQDLPRWTYSFQTHWTQEIVKLKG